MPEMIVNEADLARLARERAEYLGAFGVLDAKRPDAWRVYGYPDDVPFEKLLAAYERGGPAHGAVHRLLDKCWQERPRIKRPEADEETTWEIDLAKMLSGIKAWQKLRDFDRRNMVGHFSALIYRVADGKTLAEPLERAQRLVDIVPVYENQIKVTRWHDDERDAERFGKPAMCQYRARSPNKTDTQAQPERWVDVHPSRVQFLAEGSVGDDIFGGVPLLRAGFNHLIDLEKIAGGSAESYLKNSARTLHFKFDANASLQQLATNPDGTPSGQSVRDVIEERAQAVNRNQDASIVTQGGEVATLQTQQSDPTKAFEVAANLFAAAVRIPFTILFGQQTGRLASDEDKADMVARAKSRQVNDLTPMLEEFVTRMQDAGVIEAGEFEIEWPPLDAPGDAEKLDQLGKMTTAMGQAFNAGVPNLFSADELRAVADYEPQPADLMGGEGSDPAGADPLVGDDPPPGAG